MKYCYAFFWNIHSPKRITAPPITAPKPGASLKTAKARMAAINGGRYKKLATSAVRFAKDNAFVQQRKAIPLANIPR